MLSDREKLVANWYVTMHSVIMGSIISGIDMKELFHVGAMAMEKYRVSNCPRVSAQEMREIHGDLRNILKDFKKILEFNDKNIDSFGV